jgi:hypothetical protein
MRRLTLALAAMLGLFAATSADAAIVFDIANQLGSSIEFNGDGTTTTITLTPSLNSPPNPITGNHDFTITNVHGGVTPIGAPGSAAGFSGDITGPGFTYSAGDIVVNGATQTAALGGAGNVLHLGPDGGGDSLTADIAGINIMTMGTGGTVNFTGTVNLTNISYTGTNTDLLTFLSQTTGPGNGGVASLTFQFIPSKSLTDLLGPGTFDASYSGTLAAVPEPGTVVMAMAGLPVMGLVYLRRRKAQA